MSQNGLQPDVGHEVRWVLRDCLSEEVSLAQSALATETDLAALLTEVRATLEESNAVVISEGQLAIRQAVSCREHCCIMDSATEQLNYGYHLTPILT